MKKVITAILASVFMGFIGMILGILADEFFGGASIEIAPLIAVVFVIITMGSFIIYYNDKK